MASFNRRDFLKATGTFIVTASLVPQIGCGDDDGNGGTPDGGSPDAGMATIRFPHGVASGDPRETSVVLWTRAERIAAGSGAIALTLQVATDMAFTAIVATQNVQAQEANDFTVRAIVTNLTAATTYYYRFTGGGASISGRTRTAAAAGADVPVYFAWVNCQDYEAGLYHAFKQLLADDDARPAAEKIQFVVHLGDFIYETRGNGFQQALDENFRPITVKNPDGSDRVVAAFPSGTPDHAVTVDDYRHLYKTYLSDPDMQAARARWPFIHTWDDHEFTNDCWQSMANYTNEDTVDEPSQRRKVAANQAWFEYVPCQLTNAPGVTGVTQRARDFTPTTVTDAPFTAPDDNNFVAEANNAAAVGSMTIYRSFRFGRHVELVMTDERSYRSDHAIAETPATSMLPFFDNRNVLPFNAVNVLDQGRTANGGSPPDSVDGVPNTRKTSPPGTMLGAQQKQWFKDTLKNSDATWKIWGNEVMVMRMRVNASGAPILIYDRVSNGDGWDGYNSERKELMGYLRSENIQNVVVITGDIHASFAGIVMDDYDAATPVPVATEIVAAGISSNSVFSFFVSRAEPLNIPAVFNLVAVDMTAQGGSKYTENLNLLLVKGSEAAAKFAETKDVAMANAAAVVANPHLKYADTNSQGYATLAVTATQCTAEIVTVNRPTSGAASVLRRATFTVPKDNPAGLTGPVISGTKPFPLT